MKAVQSSRNHRVWTKRPVPVFMLANLAKVFRCHSGMRECGDLSVYIRQPCRQNGGELQACGRGDNGLALTRRWVALYRSVLNGDLEK